MTLLRVQMRWAAVEKPQEVLSSNAHCTLCFHSWCFLLISCRCVKHLQRSLRGFCRLMLTVLFGFPKDMTIDQQLSDFDLREYILCTWLPHPLSFASLFSSCHDIHIVRCWPLHWIFAVFPLSFFLRPTLHNKRWDLPNDERQERGLWLSSQLVGPDVAIHINYCSGHTPLLLQLVQILPNMFNTLLCSQTDYFPKG